MKRFLAIILMAIVSGQGFGQLPKKTNTVNVNGIELYYEEYGKGEPLLLLHGWTQSSRFWSEYIATYAQHFTVYAIDLRGHGRTTPLSDDFTIEKSASDILAFLDHLKIEKVKAIGLSYGGLALLQLASLHPEKIASMILVGASPNYDGGKNTDPDNTFSYENLPPDFVEQLKAVHYYGEEQIKALFDPTLDYKIDLGEMELKAIHCKTLIVHGDRDEILGVDPAITLHKNLPNSELWVVPDTGHIAITGPNRDGFLAKSVRFFNKR